MEKRLFFSCEEILYNFYRKFITYYTLVPQGSFSDLAIPHIQSCGQNFTAT